MAMNERLLWGFPFTSLFDWKKGSKIQRTWSHPATYGASHKSVSFQPSEGHGGGAHFQSRSIVRVELQNSTWNQATFKGPCRLEKPREFINTTKREPSGMTQPTLMNLKLCI